MNEHELRSWHRALRHHRTARAEPRPKRSSLVREQAVRGGLCARCRSPRGAGGTTRMCAACAQQAGAQELQRHARLQAEGRCIRCRGFRFQDGTRLYCRRCQDERNARDRRRRAQERERAHDESAT